MKIAKIGGSVMSFLCHYKDYLQSLVVIRLYTMTLYLSFVSKTKYLNLFLLSGGPYVRICMKEKKKKVLFQV